jgi:hypothetical protein
VLLSINSNSKYVLFNSGVKVINIETGNLLKFAPLLLGNKYSWNINGSVCISLIYLGFPLNSIKSQSWIKKINKF